MKFNQPVAIGICTKNNADTIVDTLQSILNLDYPRELFDVIVVDGLSTDKTIDLVENALTSSGLSWRVLSDQGCGLGYARQLIVDNTEAEFIAWVDADQCLSPSWLRIILSQLLSMPKIAAVRGAQGITRNLPLPAALENYVKNIDDTEVGVEAKAIYFAIGGSVLRKNAVIAAGGFNPLFSAVAEDTDLAARLEQIGWQIHNSAHAIFYHKSRSTWRALFRQYRNFGQGFATANRHHPDTFKRISTIDLIASFLISIAVSPRYFSRIFKISHNLAFLLLPLHHTYKLVAWLIGYLLSSDPLPRG